MTLTRQQRINGIGTAIVTELTQAANTYRKLLTEGLNVPATEGQPAMQATGQELTESLGDNAPLIQKILGLILDGETT